jgi:TPR repeat protein
MESEYLLPTFKDLYTLAKSYEYGTDTIEKNQITAYKIYYYLANNGCCISQHWLGKAYLDNLFYLDFWQNLDDHSIIPKVIEELLKSYYFYNNIDAWHQIIRIYQRNYINGKRFLMLAARQEYPDALCDLAEIYINPQYHQQNIPKAKQLLELAIEKNHPLAKFKLGKIYEQENKIDLAVSLYLHAAEQNCNQAQFELSNRYFDGDHVEQNIELGIKLLKQVAEAGLPVAQYVLSMRYFDGYKIETDLNLSISWCRKAAENGHPSAQNILGLRYAHGLDIEKDLDKAKDWLSKSVIQNFADAQYNLAELYNSPGSEIDIDLEKAIKLYKRAAKQNHLEAKFSLANSYRSMAFSVNYARNLSIEQKQSSSEFYLQEAKRWDSQALRQEEIATQQDKLNAATIKTNLNAQYTCKKKIVSTQC